MAKILLLNDIKFISVGLKNILSSLGYKDIDLCESGTKIIEQFKEDGNSYDLIFINLSLPSSVELSDSIDAVKKIKVLDSDAKIVMIKPAEDQQKILKAIQAGAIDYINKPLNLENIKEVLKKLQL